MIRHTHSYLDHVLHSLCGLACGLAVLTAVAGAGSAEEPSLQAPAAPPNTQPNPSVSATTQADPSIALRGSVWRTKAGIVFLKTPIGMLTLSSKTTLKDLKASQEVWFWLRETSIVVEVRKRGEGTLVHRYLSGPMRSATDSSKQLLWWTPDGERAVHLGTHEERLALHHDGDPLTVEVDDTDTVIGVHDLQFDLQVGQAPPTGSDAHVLLSGTVSKLKSNFVFLRTPIGVVTVNTKIGVRNAKVGQRMTLHIDQGRVDIDLVAAGSSVTRPTPRASTAPAP
jgi:hypothetical protein